MSHEERVEAVQKFLLNDVRKVLRMTAGKQPDLSRVIVWLKECSTDNKTEKTSLRLGLALGNGTGCSPFCGCAVNRVGEFIEGMLKEKFSWISHVRGEALIPSQSVIDRWNQD